MSSAAGAVNAQVACDRAPAFISDFSWDAWRLENPVPWHFLRRASDLPVCSAPSAQVSLHALPLITQTAYNSAYPRDGNNGLMWAGRGYAASLEGGFLLRAGPVEVRLQPTVAFQENRAFSRKHSDLPGYSEYLYMGHPTQIDWPQRFGDDSYWSVHPGQSSVRMNAGPVNFGVATENLWLGPALRYPILLSNTAEGFPHAFVGTRQPVHTPIGDFAGLLFYGQLDESDYFDDVEDNNKRIMHGVLVEYHCNCVPGLTLGAARLYTMQQDGSALELMTQPYFRSDDVLPFEDNGLFALYGHYALPAARAEFWGEWAHEAPYRGFSDLLNEPDQSQGYTLGVQKYFSFRGRDLRAWFELAHLTRAMPANAARPNPTFYTHSAIRQGHTQRGQLLGAWIGPGADAQVLGLALRGARYEISVYGERVRYDADAYYDQWSRYYGHTGHDAELAGGMRQVWDLGRGVQIGADLSYAQRFSRSFINLDGSIPAPLTYEHNVHFELQAIWNPGIALTALRRVAP